MPNIILDKKIIPELVMSDANPAKLSGEAIALLKDPARQKEMHHDFDRLRQQLGRPGVVRSAAEAILVFASK
jgi:lipid-A-disaccharide synthase